MRHPRAARRGLTHLGSRMAALAILLISGCASQPKPSPGTLFRIVPDPADPTRIRVILGGPGVNEIRRRVASDPDPAKVDQFLYIVLAPEAVGSATLPPHASVQRRLPPTPPLLAKLSYEGVQAVLTPQVTLTPGLSYQAVFEGPELSPALPRMTAAYSVPAERGTSSALIEVRPALATLPANLLKFYVYFGEPMSEGRVFQFVSLLDERGRKVPQAFREVELWADGHRRLTLWINPGRTKRSLGLSESLGAVLEEGRRYTLEIRPGLPDQKGRPLESGLTHRFRTTAPDRSQPSIGSWTLSLPAADTSAPLTVSFTEPTDDALARRLIRVETADGREVEGTAALDPDLLSWSLKPARAWSPGEYSLVAGGEIEDLAGNSLFRPFETPDGQGQQPATDPPDFRRPFTIGPPGS